MADLSQLSKEAKEAFMNSKMEEIRRKNEELRKRYEEVEADKRNAEMYSKAAYMKKNMVQGNNVEKPMSTKPPGSVGRGKRLEKAAQEKLRAPEYQRRQQRLSEDENPPPDPVYNFLHDKSREGKDTDDRRQKSRRHISNFGGQDFANVRNTMQMRKTQEREHPPGPPRNKMDLTLRMTGRERKEYENWRIEREKIEEDRLARQRTATGEWRREWDKDKITQDDQDSTWSPRVFRGRGRANNRNFRRERMGRNDNSSHVDNYSSSWHSRGRGGQHYSSGRKPFPNNYENNQNAEPDTVEQTSEDAAALDRKVLVERDSLKISFSNVSEDAETESKPPNKTWVGPQPSRRVGSGRILSSSSQSDDERNSFTNVKPYKRGKSSKGPFGERGERGGRHGGRAGSRGARNDRNDRSERQIKPRLEIIPKEDKVDTEPLPSVTDKNPDKDSSLTIPVMKNAEENWETGGDESWEDVTTSGNESLELSGPAVEEVSNELKCRFEDDFDMENSIKNLSIEDQFEYPSDTSDITAAFHKEESEENCKAEDLLSAGADDLDDDFKEHLIKDVVYQANFFQTCFENPDDTEITNDSIKNAEIVTNNEKLDIKNLVANDETSEPCLNESDNTEQKKPSPVLDTGINLTKIDSNIDKDLETVDSGSLQKEDTREKSTSKINTEEVDKSIQEVEKLTENMSFQIKLTESVADDNTGVHFVSSANDPIISPSSVNDSQQCGCIDAIEDVSDSKADIDSSSNVAVPFELNEDVAASKAQFDSCEDVAASKVQFESSEDVAASKAQFESSEDVAASEPQIGSSEHVPASEPQIDSSGDVPTSEPQIDSSGDVPTSEPSIDSSGDVPTSEPSIDSSGDVPTSEPQIDSSGDVPTSEPQIDSSGDVPTSETQIDSSKHVQASEPQIDSSEDVPASAIPTEDLNKISSKIDNITDVKEKLESTSSISPEPEKTSVDVNDDTVEMVSSSCDTQSSSPSKLNDDTEISKDTLDINRQTVGIIGYENNDTALPSTNQNDNLNVTGDHSKCSIENTVDNNEDKELPSTEVHSHNEESDIQTKGKENPND